MPGNVTAAELQVQTAVRDLRLPEIDPGLDSEVGTRTPEIGPGPGLALPESDHETPNLNLGLDGEFDIGPTDLELDLDPPGIDL